MCVSSSVCYFLFLVLIIYFVALRNLIVCISGSICFSFTSLIKHFLCMINPLCMFLIQFGSICFICLNLILIIYFEARMLLLSKGLSWCFNICINFNRVFWTTAQELMVHTWLIITRRKHRKWVGRHGESVWLRVSWGIGAPMFYVVRPHMHLQLLRNFTHILN